MKASLTIPRRATASQLIARLEAAVDENLLDEIAGLVALHPHADEKVFAKMMALPVDRNTIATSGRAPIRILQRLARSRDHYLSEHARLNLAMRTLAKIHPQRFTELFQKHSSDSGLDVGMRMAIASHRRTPVDLLLRIATDDHGGLAGSSASNELARRREPTKTRGAGRGRG